MRARVVGLQTSHSFRCIRLCSDCLMGHLNGRLVRRSRPFRPVGCTSRRSFPRRQSSKRKRCEERYPVADQRLPKSKKRKFYTYHSSAPTTIAAIMTLQTLPKHRFKSLWNTANATHPANQNTHNRASTPRIAYGCETTLPAAKRGARIR